MKKIETFKRIVSVVCVLTIVISAFSFSPTKAGAMGVDEFLNIVGPLASEDMVRTGILASMTVAQAILESGWGTSELSRNANALFGMKATNWSGPTYWYKSTSWRAYGSWEESIMDHGNHLSTMERYSNLVGETDYRTACYNVAADGYCSDYGYAENLISLIEEYNLTRFDDAVGNRLDNCLPLDLGEDFVAYVRHVSSGKYVTVVNNNLRVENGVFDHTQQLHFIRQSNGSYAIINDAFNKFVDVEGARYEDGTNVSMYENTGNDNQRFYIYYTRGNFYFRCVPSKKVFDVDAKSCNLQLFGEDPGTDDLTSSARAFEILKFNLDYSHWYKNLGADDIVYIRNVSSGLMMTAKGDDVLFSGPDYTNSQKWKLLRRADGSYEFMSVSTGKFLDVAGASIDTGTTVNLWECNGSKAQGFYILPTDDADYCVIKPCYTSNVLDMGADTFDLKIYPPLLDAEVPRAAQVFEIVFEKIHGNTISAENLGNEFDAYITDQFHGYTLTDKGSGILQAGKTTKKDDQLFHFVYDASTNSYEIIGKSGLAIDVTMTQYTDACEVGLFTRNNWVSQRFRLHKDGDYYCISPIYTNRILDISTYDNKTVQLYGSEPSSARRFIIEKKEAVSENKLKLKANSSYSMSNKMLYNVKTGQNAKTVLSNFDNTSASVLGADGKSVNSTAVVGTGYSVNLVVGGTKLDSVTVVVKGDVTGDGKVDSTDYLRIKGALTTTYTLSGAYFEAADVDGDDTLNSTDYIRVKGYMLGQYSW